MYEREKDIGDFGVDWTHIAFKCSIYGYLTPWAVHLNGIYYLATSILTPISLQRYGVQSILFLLGHHRRLSCWEKVETMEKRVSSLFFGINIRHEQIFIYALLRRTASQSQR